MAYFKSPAARRTVLITVAIIGLVVINLVVVWQAYLIESQNQSLEFSTGEALEPDHLTISAKLIAIDLNRGDLTIRLRFTPNGALLGADGRSLAEPLIIGVNTSDGRTEYIFYADEPMSAAEVVISIYGEAGNYPFDRHSGTLIVTAATVNAVDRTRNMPVPISLSYTGALAGYQIGAHEISEPVVGYAEIEIPIQRTNTVVIFVVAMMLLHWLLALSALAVAISIVRGRRIEATLFSWLAGLLFALPPLRIALPGVPPIGALIDFLSFFWAEAIVALALITIVFTYVRRPMPHDRGGKS